MNWSDERYVRLYTRDTTSWLMLSFLAQGLFCLLIRKVDRAGTLKLGRAGKKGVAIAIGHGHQWGLLEPALDELVADGCVQINGDTLVIPNFIEAQEAESSDKARARKHRERIRDGVVTKRITGGGDSGGGVTPASPGVTDESRGVSPASRETEAVASRDATVTPNQPSQPNQPNGATPSQPAEPAGGEWLAGLQQDLGKLLGWDKPLALGKDATRTRRVFEKWLNALGRDAVVSQCLQLAEQSSNGTPQTLGWFCGWLETVTDAELDRAAAKRARA